MSESVYILHRAQINCAVVWDSSQVTAAQKEGEVLADIKLYSFIPKPNTTSCCYTFSKGDIHYTIIIPSTEYDSLRTRCLLNLEPEFTTMLHYEQRA